jgi:hypothetical protein
VLIPAATSASTTRATAVRQLTPTFSTELVPAAAVVPAASRHRSSGCADSSCHLCKHIESRHCNNLFLLSALTWSLLLLLLLLLFTGALAVPIPAATSASTARAAAARQT